MTTVISVEHLSKSYRLGQIGTGTFAHDLNVWWAKLRGKPNPMLRIGETDHGNREGESLWALKDVSFQVEQGEVLGIIGRNGAGKSTLLKILSRVTAPTSGRIRLKGRVASLLEVGTGFHPELTGRENTFLNGAILGMSQQEVARKFDEIVDFAELENFIDTPVKRYSSGMYVRLAFSVAAHLEPDILLVDEVLAVGDVAFQKKCLGRMSEIGGNGRTILFVSHYLPTIVKLCARSLLFLGGTLITDGPSEKVSQIYLRNHTTSVVLPKAQSLDGRTSIELTNTPKELQVYLLGNLKLQATVSTKDILSNKVFGFQICTENGDILSTITTRDSGIQLKDCHNFRISVLFSVPFPPGRYFVNAFLFQDNAGFAIPSTPVAVVEILSASAIDGFFYPPGRIGSTVIAGSWSLS